MLHDRVFRLSITLNEPNLKECMDLRPLEFFSKGQTTSNGSYMLELTAVYAGGGEGIVNKPRCHVTSSVGTD